MEPLSSSRLFGAVALLVVWTALLTFVSSVWARRQFEVPPAWDHTLYLSMSASAFTAPSERLSND